MKKSMIHLAGWAALLVVGLIALPTIKAETETRLKSEAATKLTQAGVTGVTVAASGQDLILNGASGKIAAAQALLKPDGFWTGPVAAVSTLPAKTVAPVSSSVATESADASGSVSDSSAPASASASSSSATTVAAAEPAKPLPRAAQRCQDRINAVVARGIRYKFNAYELTPHGERTMREVHRVLQRCPANVKLTITGYTDNVGSDAINTSLSAGRAVDAMNALTARGWPDDKFTAVGAGSADPVASNATAAGRKKNRRVVFTLSSAS